jgi:hypothetical protein
MEDKLIFVPRADRSMRQYNVYLGAPIKIARRVEQGHKYIVVTVNGKENTVFPIPTSGWGFGYGRAFGRNSS